MKNCSGLHAEKLNLRFLSTNALPELGFPSMTPHIHTKKGPNHGEKSLVFARTLIFFSHNAEYFGKSEILLWPFRHFPFFAVVRFYRSKRRSSWRLVVGYQSRRERAFSICYERFVSPFESTDRTILCIFGVSFFSCCSFTQLVYIKHVFCGT